MRIQYFVKYQKNFTQCFSLKENSVINNVTKEMPMFEKLCSTKWTLNWYFNHYSDNNNTITSSTTSRNYCSQNQDYFGIKRGLKYTLTVCRIHFRQLVCLLGLLRYKLLTPYRLGKSLASKASPKTFDKSN